MNYDKPALDITAQIEVLKDRNLTIENNERTQKHLSNIGYYRLSAYMLPFKTRKDGLGESFKEGTSWDHIYDLYVFDRKLRLLLFDAIERIEIGIRSQISNQLSLKYGSHWQDNPDIFKLITKTNRKTGKEYSIDIFSQIQEHLSRCSSSSTELFIKHYRAKYKSPENPPGWMSIETFYFSQLSLICEGLKNRNDLKGLSSYYGIPKTDIFCSWLHSLNYLRNLCAHHSRVWNREINIPPMKLQKTQRKWISNPIEVQSSRIYYLMCIINYFLQTINPTNTFKDKLKSLFSEYPNIDKGFMGFPEEWENEEIWK